MIRVRMGPERVRSQSEVGEPPSPGLGCPGFLKGEEPVRAGLLTGPAVTLETQVRFFLIGKGHNPVSYPSLPTVSSGSQEFPL